jgi:hypothetical protein
MRYANGDIYEGMFRSDAKHGKGLMKFNNNQLFEGEFKEGKIDGNGKMNFANGDVYEGTYLFISLTITFHLTVYLF